MNSRNAFCALRTLKEECDSYLREMDSHFEDLEEWKESLKSDIQELLKGNHKRLVVAKNPTSCSKNRTRQLYIIKESGDECDDGTVQNISKDSKSQTIQSDLISYAVENNVNCSNDTYSHSPYLSSLVSHSCDDVREQQSKRSHKNRQKNSEGSISERIVTDQPENLQRRFSSNISNLDERTSTRSSCRKLRSINKIAKNSIDRRNKTRNQSPSVDKLTSTNYSLSEQSYCMKEKESLCQKNSRGEVFEQQIVQMVPSVGNVLMDSAKNMGKVVSGTTSSGRIVKNLKKTTKDSVNSKNCRNLLEVVNETISNTELLSHESECVRKESFVKSQISPSTKSTDQLKNIETKSTNNITLVDLPENVNEEVLGTRSSQRILNNNINKSKISVNRMTKSFMCSKKVLDPDTNGEFLYSCQNKENGESVGTKNLGREETEIKVDSDGINIQNELNSVSACNMFNSETDNVHGGEILNKDHGQPLEGINYNPGIIDVNNENVKTTGPSSIIMKTGASRVESSVIVLSSDLIRDESLLGNNNSTLEKSGSKSNGDSSNNIDIANPFHIEPSKTISADSTSRLTTEVINETSLPVETKKRRSEDFEKSCSFKKSRLIQENATEVGLNVGATVENADKVERRDKTFDKVREPQLHKISCHIEENKVEDENCTINSGNDSVMTQEHNTDILEFESNLNSESKKSEAKHHEKEFGKKCDKKLENNFVSFIKNQQIKKKECFNGIFIKTNPEILKTTKRITRSKARALNAAGNLNAMKLDMKLTQDVISNKERSRKSINKAVKTLLSANKKRQGGKENSIASTSRKHFTPLTTSKVLADVNVSSSSLLNNSSKKTPFTHPVVNFGSAIEVMESTKKRNIITNVETFIKKPAKPIDTEEKRKEDLKKREEKENDALRRKEEMLKRRAEEQKKKKEERRLKVILNREAQEKEKKEIQERIGKEKIEKLNTLLQEKEVKLKGNVIKKKQETEKKTADRKLKIEGATNVAKVNQEQMIQKTVLEDAKKESIKNCAEEKMAVNLWEKMEQKTKEMAQLKQKTVLQKNVVKQKPTVDLNTTWVKPTTDVNTNVVEQKSTVDLNTTWVKPTTDVNTKAVNSSETETLSNAYFLDDLLSEDSDNEDENNRQKKTARWAKRSRLLLESRWQLLLKSRANKMFSFSKAIDIFPNKRLLRTSSAKWDTPPRWSVLPKY